jgi:uncharacterized membrane protein YgcG
MALLEKGLMGPIIRNAMKLVSTSFTSNGWSRHNGLLVLALSGLMVLLAFAVIAGARGANAQSTGWQLDRFDISYEIQPNGDVRVVELIDVDFMSLPSRGLLRDLRVRGACPEASTTAPPLYECPTNSDRLWEYTVHSVEYGDGRSVPWSVEDNGVFRTIRIGDANIFLEGKQSYRIEYTVRGALDAYPDHDEFFWDALSGWEVPILEARVRVDMPFTEDARAGCFQGYYNSEQECNVENSGSFVVFTSNGPIQPGMYMTVLTGWERGLVEVAPPLLEKRTEISDFYEFDTAEFLGAGATGALGIFGVLFAWARWGRDRRYKTVHYLTNDTTEETPSLFSKETIVVEYLPPDNLKPGQMGVIIDERADTLDVTATIIDLAVHGYLQIKEIPKKGWFGSTDWELTRLKQETDKLEPFEKRLFEDLFSKGDTLLLSSLKDTFASKLKRVKGMLYTDAKRRDWFAGNPETIKTIWLFIGFGAMAVGAGVTFLAATLLGRFLIGAPLVIAGLLLVLLSRSMSRRTAKGSEALRRVLGFKLYIETAETHRQEFNEQENIFARYLPYAIVFECVDKWAKAFEDMGRLEQNAQNSVASWYIASSAFNVNSFSNSLGSLSSSMSSTIASTPSSSGGSGFSGGSAGGGGGGGCGGRW